MRILDEILGFLLRMADKYGSWSPPLRRRDVAQHRGSLRNVWSGHESDALNAATRAMDALKATSAGSRLESGPTSRAWVLASQDRWDDALRGDGCCQSDCIYAVRAEVFRGPSIDTCCIRKPDASHTP